jgi:hypothetical protein
LWGMGGGLWVAAVGAFASKHSISKRRSRPSSHPCPSPVIVWLKSFYMPAVYAKYAVFLRQWASLCVYLGERGERVRGARGTI